MRRNVVYISVVLACVILTCASRPGYALRAPEHGPLPSLFSSLRIHTQFDFCGEKVPLDNQEVRERLEKALALTVWDRPQVILWIKRSHRYMPIIEKMLTQHGMPDDLKYITLIESALRPHAGSSKGAIGFWQFTEGTGRRYGLKIDTEIDERRNIFASTDAAMRCLKALHETFGSWTLAAAAFNMGSDGLQTEILVQKTNDYYHLYLPLETQFYVFRVLAAKLILTNPEKFAFHYSKKDLYPPLRYDRIGFTCPEKIPIRIVADAAGTYFKTIKDLNPEIRGYYLSAGDHTILIPKGASKGFAARFKKLSDTWSASKNEHIYTVKKGDNLSTIAERFGVPLPALFLWNNLKLNEPIHPGDRLIIYGNTEKIPAGGK
jgi:membrane-bound lytic murein transglycosylase D